MLSTWKRVLKSISSSVNQDLLAEWSSQDDSPCSTFGENRWFATAEDTILVKLEWSRMADSERQFIDALNVAKLQRNNLDGAYLKKWAGRAQHSGFTQKTISRNGEEGKWMNHQLQASMITVELSSFLLSSCQGRRFKSVRGLQYFAGRYWETLSCK